LIPADRLDVGGALSIGFQEIMASGGDLSSGGGGGGGSIPYVTTHIDLSSYASYEGQAAVYSGAGTPTPVSRGIGPLPPSFFESLDKALGGGLNQFGTGFGSSGSLGLPMINGSGLANTRTVDQIGQGQSFLQELGFGISHEEFSQFGREVADFEREIRVPVGLYGDLLHIGDRLLVPQFIIGTGVTMVGAGIASVGFGLIPSSVATGPGVALLVPAGIFLTGTGVAVTRFGLSMAFGPTSDIFGSTPSRPGYPPGVP